MSTMLENFDELQKKKKKMEKKRNLKLFETLTSNTVQQKHGKLWQVQHELLHKP